MTHKLQGSRSRGVHRSIAPIACAMVASLAEVPLAVGGPSSDAAYIDVNARTASSVTVTVEATLDCGSISAGMSTCSESGERTGSLVVVEAFGAEQFDISTTGPILMEGPDPVPFTIEVHAYELSDLTGAGTPITEVSLGPSGTANFRIFPDDIVGLTPTTISGIYAGTGTLTVEVQ